MKSLLIILLLLALVSLPARPRANLTRPIMPHTAQYRCLTRSNWLKEEVAAETAVQANYEYGAAASFARDSRQVGYPR